MFIWTIRTILVFAKQTLGYGNTLPKQTKLGKSHFLRLSGKSINSSGVSSQKLYYVNEAPAGAFISEKLTFLNFWDMLILKKLNFCSYLVRMSTQTLKETLRKPSGDSLGQSGLGTAFGSKSNEFICVFLSKVVWPTISPQTGEGDMHEVPRLRTKVVRGFRERVQHQAKARITKTARTPIAKAIWGIIQSRK